MPKLRADFLDKQNLTAGTAPLPEPFRLQNPCLTCAWGCKFPCAAARLWAHRVLKWEGQNA